MDQVSRIIGTLEAGLSAQEKRLNAQDAKLADMDGKLDQLLANQQQQRGARKIMAMLGTGAGATAGALIGWVVTWVTSTRS